MPGCSVRAGLRLPAFNLNEPVQAHCSLPQSRMHLCETQGECLMGRRPLHSQSFHYRASLHFTAWSAASTRAPLPASCQPPIQTLAGAGGPAMPCAGRSTFWASAPGICQGPVPGRALTVPPLLFSFNQQLLRLQKGCPGA